MEKANQTYYLDHVETYGLAGAKVLSHLIYFVAFSMLKEQNYKDGKFWTWYKGGMKARVGEYFKGYTPRQIDYATNKLIKAGAVEKNNYNSTAYYRVLWYTVNMNLFYFEVFDTAAQIIAKTPKFQNQQHFTKLLNRLNNFAKSKNQSCEIDLDKVLNLESNIKVIQEKVNKKSVYRSNQQTRQPANNSNNQKGNLGASLKQLQYNAQNTQEGEPTPATPHTQNNFSYQKNNKKRRAPQPAQPKTANEQLILDCFKWYYKKYHQDTYTIKGKEWKKLTNITTVLEKVYKGNLTYMLFNWCVILHKLPDSHKKNPHQMNFNFIWNDFEKFLTNAQKKKQNNLKADDLPELVIQLFNNKAA